MDDGEELWEIEEEDRSSDPFDLEASDPVESSEPPDEVVPFTAWCAQVDYCLQQLTNFGQCIETVGYFDWWEEYFQEGLTPEEAANQALVRELLLAHE